MYQALYRKYRPKNFDSVIGQDAIVKTLINSIANKKFSHAYMFFGPRGTGKTTVSKIFARSINCLKPVNGIACGKCDACKNSFSKDCIDIIEIDAASNNGVDEIRELKNRISLVPSELSFKVYIIDEVHMLSIGAFNALLKTLEEPPEHAVFILATTDPQKVPETIVSRCQCFSFNRISSDIIIKKLVEICSYEKIDIDDEVLHNIALLADGGMRDALGMLDKLVSYSEKKISMAEFAEVNSVALDDELHQLLDSIFNSDVAKMLNILNDFDSRGKNLIQIMIQLLSYIRSIVVNYYIDSAVSEYNIDLLLELANYINENLFDIKRSDNIRISIEIFLLKFVKNSNENEKQASESVKNQVSQAVDKKNLDNSYNNDSNYLEDKKVLVPKNTEESKNTESMPNKKILNIDDIIKVRINNTLATADKALLTEELKKFELLKDYTFDQNFGYIVCSLLDSKIRVVGKNSMIISFAYDSNVKQNLSILNEVIDVYNNITKSDKLIAIVSDAEWDTIKSQYISNIKNKIKYEIEEEPKLIFEEVEKDDIINNNAIELFGDIVEIE